MHRSKHWGTGIAIALAILLPAAVPVRDIIWGSIPFWFDPARDLLRAWDSLDKPTLLGPSTGIPGIFYGPYWIWLLSFPLRLSKDPRLVVFLVQTLPYFTIFPFILYQLTRPLGKHISLLLWFLFAIAYKNYTTYLWNPHLAPLLFLIVIWLVIESRKSSGRIGPLATPLAAGLVVGLLTNFHLAFGVGIIIAVFLWYTLLGVGISVAGVRHDIIATTSDGSRMASSEVKDRKPITNLGIRSRTMVILFALGLLVAFIPTVVFEARHNYSQTQSVIATVKALFTEGTTGVSLKGFSKLQILTYTAGTLGSLLVLPAGALWIIYTLIFISLVLSHRRHSLQFSKAEIRLVSFLSLTAFTVISLFLIAPNPVWHYHFIGMEIVFLLLLGLLVKKVAVLRWILSAWVFILVLTSAVHLIKSLSEDPLYIPSLSAKRHIVEEIYSGAGSQPFSVFAYSTSIYTYDFDYLFRWIADKRKVSEPIPDATRVATVYLIIPETTKPIEEDFINYKTPNTGYATTMEWVTKDKTLVLRRKRLTPLNTTSL